MANMDRVLELQFRSTDEECYYQESYDWTLSHVFQDPRHVEKIEGSEVSPQGWRMKERMKTVSVALVLCLNVGVDPPGLIKLQPCARLECWVDPLSLSPQKALEQIGQNLQKQYERWQPRARYKQSLDPTVDEVKKLCVSLRRNAKEERVLFHYNGHGVPCPTNNGEVWVFNRNYTQYIPLSIYDLQTWMGYPSIYVYDCNKAGVIIKSFAQFAEQHEREYYNEVKSGGGGEGTESTPPPPNYSSCIQLGACSDNQVLPMNPDLPADLFTACLTTPIKMALRWFVLQNQQHQGKLANNKLLNEGINLDTVERVPGQLNDRRTMLGELNWIFTAITDTIAWNILPRALFQKLFRQDLLVASLFRNFLLAERIMRSYDCTPVSSPKLPPTSHHPMWHAWDYALDQCLTQLKAKEAATSPSSPPAPVQSATLISNEPFTHVPSPFFEEQLTAFEVWLTLGNEKRHPPEQLPIVLQVLLSQVHRVRALELLGKFLDLGWWAVNLALSVGIFPYVLKLLQSSAKELRPLLVFIWAKILAVDQTCQTDLVRDGSHKYFIQMVNDPSLPCEYRTMAVFVLSNIVRNYQPGQQAAMQANSISTCLLSLEDSEGSSSTAASLSSLHKWVCICLGLTFQDYPNARWCGVRDSAHEKIASVLSHENAEVRAAAVFALGSFVNGMDRSEHSNSIDHSVVLMVLNQLGEGEGSGLVRQEIVVALHNFVLVFENQFVNLAERHMVQESQVAALLAAERGAGGGALGSLMSPVNLRRVGGGSSRMRALANAQANPNLTITGAEALYYSAAIAGGSGGGGGVHQHAESMRRVASSSSLSNLLNVFVPPAAAAVAAAAGGSAGGIATIYTRVWSALVGYERDPDPGVSILARTVLEHVRTKALHKSQTYNQQVVVKGREAEDKGTPTSSRSSSSVVQTPTTPSSSGGVLSVGSPITPIVATRFISWCWSQYSRPSGNHTEMDPQDQSVCTRNWVYGRNAKSRRDCFKRVKNFPGKIDEQVVGKNLSEFVRTGGYSCVKFHPYENLLVIGGATVYGGGGASDGANSNHNSLQDLRISHHHHEKSVFLVFEYDDTSPLSAYTPYTSHHHAASSSPTTPGSGSTSSSTSTTPSLSNIGFQPRVLNRTEIDHIVPTYLSTGTSNTPYLCCLEWLNSHDSIVTGTCSLLATGCSDGCVRVYKPSLEQRQSQLVVAWNVCQQQVQQNSRRQFKFKYDAGACNLVCSYHGSKGGSVLGIWDVRAERVAREIGGSNSNCDSKVSGCGSGGFGDWGVTSLDCNRCEPNVFVLGGEDGGIRLLDVRVPSTEVTPTWCDFVVPSSGVSSAAITCVKLRHDRTIVSGSSSGRVRFFDFRSKTPTKTVDTTVDVTTLDIHSNLPYFGVGTTTSTVNVYGFHGHSAFLANSIREGFGGFGRIGLASNSITSMTFHEYKPFMCFVDSYSHFSVYKAKK